MGKAFLMKGGQRMLQSIHSVLWGPILSVLSHFGAQGLRWVICLKYGPIGQETNARCVCQHQQRLTALLKVTSCLDPACLCLTPFQTPNPCQPPSGRWTTWPRPLSLHSPRTSSLDLWHYKYSHRNSLGQENKKRFITLLYILPHHQDHTCLLCVTN